MSKCIECNSPAFQLITQQNSRYKYNNSRTAVTSLFSKQERHGYTLISSHTQLIISSFKVEALPPTSSLSLAAVAKPADPVIMLQTSALLIFMYLMANFVVPQLLSKSLGLDKTDEDKPISSKNDEKEANSTSDKGGFNSTKPR